MIHRRVAIEVTRQFKHNPEKQFMEMNLNDVHPDLQEHVQTIHDAITAIIGATHLDTEVRRIALQESENLYDEAFDNLQDEDDEADPDEDGDDDDDVDECEGEEEAEQRFPGEDDMPEAGDEDDEEDDE